MKRATAGLLPITIIMATSLWSCKRNGEDSEAKFDEATASALEGLQLTDADLKQVCDTRTLVVYVGNAERIGNFKDLKASPHKADFEALNAKNDAAFDESIKRGWTRLVEAMGRSKCLERETFDTVTLAKIYDGPGANDSAVETVTFSRADGKVQTVNQKYDVKVTSKLEEKTYAVELTRTDKPKAFELNMPRSLNSLVSQIFMQNDKSYHNIFYVFKTHGGLYVEAPAKISLFERPKPDKKHQVFLFDNYGADGKPIKSNLYSAFWYQKHACEIYKKSSQEKAKEYAAAECQSVDSGAAGQGNGSAGQGNGSAGQGNGSAGQGNGSAGQGNGSAGQGNGSAGQGNGSAGQGNGSAGQGNGSAGQGNGSAGQGNGSAGQGNGSAGQGNGSAGQGNGSAGGGKGGFFLGEIPAVDPKASEEEQPDGYLEVGEAASYTNLLPTLEGVVNVSVFTGTAVNGYNAVLLDSCYGSPGIGGSIRDFSKPIKRVIAKVEEKLHMPASSTKIVIMANQAPIYYDLIDYGKLRGDLFLALPLLMYKGGKDNDSAYADAIGRVKSHFKEGLTLGSDQAKKDGVVKEYDNTDYKRLFVDFLEL